MLVAFPAVRTTNPCVTEGNCAKETYICRSGRGRSWYILISLTMPTIVQIVCCSPNRSSRPMGSWFGQNSCASVSLIIAGHFALGGSERAARDQPNLHRRKIIGGDRGELGAPSFSRLRRRLVRCFDFDRRSEATERHMTSLAYSDHLRQCMEAFQRILTEISQA